MRKAAPQMGPYFWGNHHTGELYMQELERGEDGESRWCAVFTRRRVLNAPPGAKREDIHRLALAEFGIEDE